MSTKASEDSKKTVSSRQSFMERYAFGYTSELSNQECSMSQAKRLRERLQRQQSGQSGRGYTGESSGCSSMVGTPTETGRSFTFTAQKTIKDERKSSISPNLSELMLDAIHFDDIFLVERTLAMYSSKQPLLFSSPSVGSTNTLTDLAQKRHHNNQRRSNASSILSTHSSGKSICGVLNTLHMAIAHKKYEIVQRLLEYGFDPNGLASCHCKGGCTATGNIPLTSITASRALSITPELCTICAQLRVVSIINQTPLAIAVRAQNAEIIALLITYGADPNLSDDDGNTPLMIAVRECPSSINILYTLVFFGSQIELKNVRGTSPLDLSPELRKIQARCIEDLFSKACCVGMKSEGKEDARRLGSFFGLHTNLRQPLEHEYGSAGRLDKSLSPLKNILTKNLSTTPSVSTICLIDAALIKEKCLKRKSQSSIQLGNKQFAAREEESNGSEEKRPSAWERAWILLKKMAVNPECLEVIQVMLQKYVGDMELNSLIPDKDTFDAHLGGLLHRMLQTSIAEYQSATPTYREAKKLHLLSILSSLAKFCFQYLQKEEASRQFSALNTLNKIIDAGLVHEFFVFPEITFHSSRFVKKLPIYDDGFSEVVSLCDSVQLSDDQNSTVDHVFLYSREKNGHDFPGFFQRHPKRKLDLIDVFASAEPSQIIAFLHNALTMERREAGMRPVCSPAHRWRQCWKHCTQVLLARLLLFLCHITSFRAGMSSEEQLSLLAKVLEPTLDPQLLCLILQTLALIALDPATHKFFVELDIDDKLVQFILPADDWYHTNHSTFYGPYVKYHAARILVYVGMGDRVSNRVSIFHFPDPDSRIKKQTSPSYEDGYICQTCSTPNTLDGLDKSFISVEQILLEILEELDRKLQCRTSVDAITEETSNMLLPPSNDVKEVEGVQLFKEEIEKRLWDEHSDDSSIVLENLREHLCKIAVVVDPMLILRLLLHKLTWDLSIVKKKVAVIDSLKVGISRIRYSASLGANISKAGRGDKRDGKEENFLKVERSSSRSSRRVKIRRTSSLELSETSSYTSFIKNKERRKRLGTDTSSSSKCSRKTGSSVSKHFPKYIKTLFRKRTVTDPVRKHPPRDSSVDSNTSESEVLEFARKLQNYPMTRREALRQAIMQNNELDSFSDKPRSTCSFLPELEVQPSSPPRSPQLTILDPIDGNNSGSSLLVARRPSSPQAIPGLPLIEIRRPSAMSQIEFDYFINSPEMTCSDVSDCSPLLLTNGIQFSRKSSDESSVGGWSSRASSAISQRSSRSSTCMRLSTSYSRRTSKASITSDNSGPFLFRFTVRKRSSTIGTRIPIPRRALSPQSRSSASDSLRVPGRESYLFPIISEMNPDFHCIRQLVVDLLSLYSNKRPNIVSAVEECAEVMRQILTSPQHPKIKSWCNEIIQTVAFHIEPEIEAALVADDRVREEYRELKERILSGTLPCPKDQAAFLASIQLTIEKELVTPIRKTQELHQQLAKGQFERMREMAQKMMVTPWEVDQKATAMTNLAKELVVRKRLVYISDTRPRRTNLLGCVTDQQPMLPVEIQKKILPLSLINDRKTNRLIHERKRKLFHSRVYENEIGLKKLYIETDRLLCLSSGAINLLDASTKSVLKRQHVSTLKHWRLGGGHNKRHLLLEFKGAKWHLLAPTCFTVRGISSAFWEIMQDYASNSIQKKLCAISDPDETVSNEEYKNRDSKLSIFSASKFFASPRASDLSTSQGFTVNDEPNTIFRLELERLQFMLQFPEEVAFQLTATEYQLFNSVQPIDFVRYVSFDLTSVPMMENPSPVKNLIKRLSEVSSWITHIIISSPSHDDRRAALLSIIRMIETCWNIGNFNGAVEILTGLKSEKLCPFWSTLSKEEKKRFDQLCEMLLPSNQSTASGPYLEAVQRALKMPQCRVIPFFGIFLRDLYAIVNDMPNVVIMGHEGKKEKLEFLNDCNGEDHFSSRIGVGGLLNADKIQLVAVVLENIGVFHKHSRKIVTHVEDYVMTNAEGEPVEVKGYEPVQAVRGGGHGISLIPLDTALFDLDIVQRMHHGMTVINHDIASGRSVLCMMKLDASCSILSWHKVHYAGDNNDKETIIARTSNEKQSVQTQDNVSSVPSPTASPRPACAAAANLEDGSLDLLFVKSVEQIDSYDIDLEAIYRKHSSEDNAVPVYCWTVTYGSHISENEFLYFIAPQETAHYWLSGLTGVVKHLREQLKQPDRRVLWLKKLYLQLYSEAETGVSISTDDGKSVGGPRPLDALSAFGGQVDKYRELAETMSTKTQATEPPTPDSSGPKSRLMQMTMAVTRRMRGNSRDCSRSQSPHPIPSSPRNKRNMSIRSQASIHSGIAGRISPGLYLKPRFGAALSEGGGDADSIFTTRSRSPTASSYGARSLGARSTRSWNHTNNLNELLFTPRSRTATNSSFTGRSIGGRSFRSWKSKGRDTPNSGSVSSSGFISINTQIGKEYHEKPLSFIEFIELYRLFSARLRKDIKDIFNDCITTFGSTHITKREKEKHSPRVQSRLSSTTSTCNNGSLQDFISNEVLTRNRPVMQRFTEKQQKIYKALAMASINSMVDMQQTPFLTPAILKQFCAAYQMELIDESYAIKLIQEHEPDPYCRNKQQMTFEGFVRFLNDSRYFAFVPEEIEIECDSFNQPLSHYYISSSHNTYLTGHQLKGESSPEMYRQILLTGCRCVELDCWDGDDGFPQIFHGHTLTSKIFLRQVLAVIKKSAFSTSSFPVILSLENHCSLQQQAKMAQMIQNYLGDKLVTNFLFESDYTNNPKLPTPFQLQYRILIKNKKMVFEPSSGLLEKSASKIALRDFPRDQSKIFYESSIYEDGEDDDLDEFLDDEPDEEEDRTDDNPDNEKRTVKSSEECKSDASAIDQENRRECRSAFLSTYDRMTDTSSMANQCFLTPKQPLRKRVAAGPLAPELSDLVVYLQAVKFKGFPKPTAEGGRNEIETARTSGSIQLKTRTNTTNLLSIAPASRKLKGGNMESSPKSNIDLVPNTTQRPNINASCYQVTSLNENASRKLTRKHRSKCIAYTRDHIVRTYPGGMRIDSSNFNPTQFWAYGFQMVALNFQTSDIPMAVNTAMFEQTGNCGFVLKPRVLWDEKHPLYGRYNSVCKDPSCYSAMILTLNVISGQHVFPKQPIGSPYLEVEVIGMPCDSVKYKSKAEHRNAVNPAWSFLSVFRITCVDLAFLRIAVCDASNGRCCAQRVVPVKCLRPGYRHLPLRDTANHPLDQSMLFLFSKFEQEELIYLFDDNDDFPCNYDQELSWQILKADPSAEIRFLPVVKKQIFILKITGLNPDDLPTIVRAESSTTVRNVIQSALAKSGKSGDAAEDYVLIEERVKSPRGVISSETCDSIDNTNQRILPCNEPVMDAVACWNGFTMRFIIRKKNVDPGSRAWISSLIKSGSGQSPLTPNSSTSHHELRSYDTAGHTKSHSSAQIYEKSFEVGESSEALEPSGSGLHCRARSMGETFLVCVHNISADQPYAILRVCISSTASDIIRQVFLKSSSTGINYNDYVLVEEIAESDAFTSKKPRLPSEMGRTTCRVLNPNENVWKAQSKWKTAGRFVLENRKQTVSQALEKVRSLIEEMELAQMKATGIKQDTV